MAPTHKISEDNDARIEEKESSISKLSKHIIDHDKLKAFPFILKLKAEIEEQVRLEYDAKLRKEIYKLKNQANTTMGEDLITKDEVLPKKRKIKLLLSNCLKDKKRVKRENNLNHNHNEFKSDELAKKPAEYEWTEDDDHDKICTGKHDGRCSREYFACSDCVDCECSCNEACRDEHDKRCTGQHDGRCIREYLTCSDCADCDCDCNNTCIVCQC